MHVHPLVPLRRTVILPLVSTSATVAWAVIDGGPADSARAIFWSLVSPAAEATATVAATETAASTAMRDGMVPPRRSDRATRQPERSTRRGGVLLSRAPRPV